ncbi:MAG: VWA domain-containing protein [Paludibacteraceae bacterium]|nr:VWA domain-containing protein [Paludibacteraceae bacterium]HOU68464.1 VWA domain-containing protein [Paludibacteraceae bacterium]HQF50316.1 VWA domain-containing protein [Paludibacteraceae bacterium]
MEFESPGYLYILLALIPIIVWYIWKRKKLTPSMQISSIESFVGVKKSYKYYILHLPFVLRIGAFALIIVALARPQSFDNWETKNVEGIDIVMALDISESMLAEDFKPNRLEAAKKVGANFVASRKNDNVGVVVFSGASYPLTPLTTDKVSVVSLMGGIDYKMMDANGTAIGLGLTSAVNRLRDSKAKSKVIILLTDGSNNTGDVDPLSAAGFAKKFGIRVYTVGVGTNGMAPFPIETPMGRRTQMMKVDIDEGTLKKISEETNGMYFRATDNATLKEIYEEIDKLEKTKIKVEEYSSKEEEYLPWLIAAFALLVFEYLLRSTILRHNP